jgi:hypothetical protein
MMMKSTLFILVVIATTFPRASASSEEDEAKARALVRQLGSDSFKVREQAARELIELGGASKKALEEGCKSTDAEVAERCRKLLPQVYERYVRRLVESHRADPQLPLSEDLPGLKRWLDIAGQSDASKKLFVAVLRHSPDLLIDLHLSPDKLDEEYIKLVRFLDEQLRFPENIPGQQSQGVTQVELALFLFLATDPRRKADVKISRPGLNPPSVVLSRSNLKTYLESPSAREPFQRLFIEFLAREKNQHTLVQAVQLTESARLNEALPAILKLAEGKNTSPPLRATAVRAIGRLGGRDSLPLLTPFFDDNSPFVEATLIGGEKGQHLRVCDVALGMAIHLHGQKLTDFGFKRDLPKSEKFEDVGWFRHFLISDDAREQALTKWKAFAEKKLTPETKR